MKIAETFARSTESSIAPMKSLAISPGNNPPASAMSSPLIVLFDALYFPDSFGALKSHILSPDTAPDSNHFL